MEKQFNQEISNFKESYYFYIKKLFNIYFIESQSTVQKLE